MRVMCHSTYSEELCSPYSVKQQLPISGHDSFKGISLPIFMLCNFLSAAEEWSKKDALYKCDNPPTDLQAEFVYTPVLF